MGVKHGEHGTRIAIETDSFDPHQTILGFTLLALKQRVMEDDGLAGQPVTVNVNDSMPLFEGIDVARRQAAVRLLEIGPFNLMDDPEVALENIARFEATATEFPRTLSKIVAAMREMVWVDVLGENQAAVRSAEHDIQLMRVSGIYVTSDVQTPASNPSELT